MIKIKDIKEKYYVGAIVTDAKGLENRKIRNSVITSSPFEAIGSILIGGVLIFDSATNVWAQITN